MMTNQLTDVTYYASAEELEFAARFFIKPTRCVLDIGCGIRPQAWFRPSAHLCIEPYDPYIEVLRTKANEFSNLIILKGLALPTLALLPDKSVDSIFMVDVIEHLEKQEGRDIINELRRVARHQILIFTPYGFMPQHYEAGETDAWGLEGIEYQEHRSGWLPGDFGLGWKFHVCMEFHKIDSKGEVLERPFGAFWAVFDCEDTGGGVSLRHPILIVTRARDFVVKSNLMDIKRWFSCLQYGQYAALLLSRDRELHLPAAALASGFPGVRINSVVVKSMTLSMPGLKAMMWNLTAAVKLIRHVVKNRFGVVVLLYGGARPPLWMRVVCAASMGLVKGVKFGSENGVADIVRAPPFERTETAAH